MDDLQFNNRFSLARRSESRSKPISVRDRVSRAPVGYLHGEGDPPRNSEGSSGWAHPSHDAR